MLLIPKLKSTIGRSYSVEEDDTLTMKNVLKKLGHYETPNYGMTPFPDEPMFEGIKGFQKAKGLLVDGVVAPRGPTARALGEALRPTVPRRTMIATKAAAAGRPVVGRTAFGGLLGQAPSPKERPDARPTGSGRDVGTRLAHSTGQPGPAPRSPQPPPRVPLKDGLYSGAFLDAIAKAEHNVKGYAEVNPGNAWGRYQLTRNALIDAGIHVSKDNKWMGPLARKMGIASEQEFLNSPLAQEMAVQAYFLKTEGYLKKNGIMAYADRNIDGIEGDIALTEGTLLAAAHREGTGYVVKYLNHLKQHNWMSKRSTFPEGELGTKFLHIETRLRKFQGIRHRMR